ncbi:Rpn family recombination-promoting nuclease/putative transposase [Gloeobacter morelensis]|uniref:Rpn family recombination-promoting nuclease/putative transposase n=1 Tax=Gloeobacter morelensis MG652769 TaxID=2781736 RepID=A0ABY3PJL4_9CYAN|nr:Rpn family recombination-promoting nuclease/putative transposase [Gloeobacter morelensis]UFP93846.1 Rpn family recombination-promoting nuclease/putative transposase [Gloeobacter morelensis MG652769]
MRTDHLFYKLFEAFPETLFVLAGTQPPAPGSYRFESIEVKETALRIDGVLVPEAAELPYYFAEVQFQKDQEIYWRLFSEILLSMRRSAQQRDWRAVLIFPNRTLDVQVPAALSTLATDPRLVRVYLDEIAVEEDSPLGLSLMRLMVEAERTLPERARRLLERTQQQLPSGEARRRVLELIETIIVYKLGYSREELEAMFGLEELKNTRYFREVAQQARESGWQEGRQEGRQEGLQQGREQGELAVVSRLLTRRFGLLEETLLQRLSQLSSAQLESLAEVLLDLADRSELEQWLQQQP